MGYVTCRAAETRTADWERCVPKGLSAARIRKCAEGPEGRRLLAESFRLADDLDVAGSPSWIVNDHYEMQGRDAARIVAAYCERNPVAACERPVAPEQDVDDGRPDVCRE
jgi:protein-disulfide isomerase-like protein with CxxC motif